MDVVHYINDEEVTIKETRWINVCFCAELFSEKKRKKKKREKRNQLGLEIRCAAASFVQPLFCLDLQQADRGHRARAKPNPF
jgi:hypothetical protein